MYLKPHYVQGKDIVILRASELDHFGEYHCAGTYSDGRSFSKIAVVYVVASKCLAVVV